DQESGRRGRQVFFEAALHRLLQLRAGLPLRSSENDVAAGADDEVRHVLRPNVLRQAPHVRHGLPEPGPRLRASGENRAGAARKADECLCLRPSDRANQGLLHDPGLARRRPYRRRRLSLGGTRMRRPTEEQSEPLWREEFSVLEGSERWVSRRQFGKFLMLTSLGMFVGTVWIALRAVWNRAPAFPKRAVARVEEVPVGGLRLFRYPGPNDPCLLLRLDSETFVAYSQKCTHLSCAVVYSPASGKLECPCHQGFFAARTGAVLQGPPGRPLPKIVLERRGSDLVATGIDLQTET